MDKGRALLSGGRGRRFKSSHSDQFDPPTITPRPKNKKAPPRPFRARGRFVLRAGRYSGSYLMGQSWSARTDLFG